MNGGQVSILYDGLGTRVANATQGVTTRYLVDDLSPTGYPQVVEELTNGVVQREYTYGLQRISQNQSAQGAWQPSFYEYDGDGNVRLLTNSSGAVTDTYEYDAFGNLISTAGTTPNEFYYRGEQYDADLGFYYLRARYYNPTTGWTAPSVLSTRRLQRFHGRAARAKRASCAPGRAARMATCSRVVKVGSRRIRRSSSSTLWA